MRDARLTCARSNLHCGCPPLPPAAATMEAGHLADSFGGAEAVLLAQEAKLEQLQGENRCGGCSLHRGALGHASQHLGNKHQNE